MNKKIIIQLLYDEFQFYIENFGPIPAQNIGNLSKCMNHDILCKLK